MSPALDCLTRPESSEISPGIRPGEQDLSQVDAPRYPNVYYNARLDPKNYLEGPLSWNPPTRLRQMLARPGIIVCARDI